MSQLITIAGAKLSKDIVKEFSSAFKDLKEFGASGAGDLKDALGSANELMGVISPLVIPLKLLSAQISSGTLQSSMNLSKELVELMEKPAVKDAIDGFINFINAALDSASRVVAAAAKFAENENKFVRLENALTKLGDTMTGAYESFETAEQKISDSVLKVKTNITDVFDGISDAIDNVVNKINGAISRINPFD